MNDYNIQIRGGVRVQNKVVTHFCKIDTIYVTVIALIFVVIWLFLLLLSLLLMLLILLVIGWLEYDHLITASIIINIIFCYHLH